MRLDKTLGISLCYILLRLVCCISNWHVYCLHNCVAQDFSPANSVVAELALSKVVAQTFRSANIGRTKVLRYIIKGVLICQTAAET